jgi:putative nucleotidyltransferase with HDIG domain
MDRDSAMALLREYTQSESLIKHALAVEAALREYARLLGGDEEDWGIVGLLHDFDYERWPQAPEHPAEGARILRERGYPEWVVRAIQSHADYSGLPRETPLEKALYSVDELAGFVIAVALVRPSKSIAEVKVSSVRKKLKDKAFAAAVNRDEIAHGAADLGVDMDEHVANVIRALQGVAAELGLAGDQA